MHGLMSALAAWLAADAGPAWVWLMALLLVGCVSLVYAVRGLVVEYRARQAHRDAIDAELDRMAAESEWLS